MMPSTREPRTLCPIAICGMAVRLPGGIRTPDEFWNFLLSKGDARSRVPTSRYNIEAYHSMSGKPGTIKSEYGYFLDDSIDIGAVDISFFSMTKTELQRLDPQQRQLLEVARECFESAGETAYRGKNVGVFVGNFGEDWHEMAIRESQPYGIYRVTGTGDFTLSNRLSYENDLRGPSLTIRTGCSAAMIALHEACMSVQKGQCTSALVAGVNLILAPGMTAALAEQGVLSPEGCCKTFSADADGYGRGEAVNAVFIKPLADALRDGSPVRAVIRSTASNCDGRTPGISNPSSERHEELIRRAYELAGIRDVSQTAFVECHGTGTPVGDPLEARAIANVFGDAGVYIGSVKPNIGHSEGASGLSSLIKTVLALEHKIIPPNIRFNKPNLKIPFESRKLRVPTEPTPWPQGRYERASVNCFGIGGANAHVILDSAANIFQTPKRIATDEPQLLLYSANGVDSLQKQIDQLQQYVQANPSSILNLAYTLALRREHLPHRSFSIAGTSVEPNSNPLTRAPAAPPEVVMIFTGQGAQWPQMGRELLMNNEVFRLTIRRLDHVLQRLPEPPTWNIEEELLKPAETSDLHKAFLSQPLCSAVQIALVETLASFAIKPAAVVGHSSGEIAAAYAAEALDLATAITVAYYRGLMTRLVTAPGAMAAIGLDWDEASKFLVDGVVIACDNSPSSVTVSGDREQVETVVSQIRKHRPGVLARVLKVDCAYHSHHVQEASERYHDLTKNLVRCGTPAPSISFFSSVTGDEYKSTLGARYWQMNAQSPVLFRQTVTNYLKAKGTVGKIFLEIGPHGALAGPLRQTLVQAGADLPYVSAITRNKNCSVSFLSCIGRLWQNAVPVDFTALTGLGTSRVLTDLPPYPWDHAESYWPENRLANSWRHRKFPHHDLLGLRNSESTDTEPSWRNVLHLDNAPWLRDHKVEDVMIFPCAAYVATAGEAVRQLTLGRVRADTPFTGFELRQVTLTTPLVLSEQRPTEMVTSLKKHQLTNSLDSLWWEFTISSYNGDGWMRHCFGQVRAITSPPESLRVEKPLPRIVDATGWYNAWRRLGLHFGTTFQGLQNISSDTMASAARASTKNGCPADLTFYPLHPTTIDYHLQLLVVAVSRGTTRKLKTLGVPTSIDSMEIFISGPEIEMAATASSTQRGVVWGCGHGAADGRVALRMSGIRLSPLTETSGTVQDDPHAAASVVWKPHIDFLNFQELRLLKVDTKHRWYGPMLEQLTQFLVKRTLGRLENIQITDPTMQNFASWLWKYKGLRINGDDNHEIHDAEPLVQNLRNTPAAPAVDAMMKIYDNIEAIATGKAGSLEVLMADSTLSKMYIFTDDMEHNKFATSFLETLSHSNPNARVLEIGAGTGGTTQSILKILTRDGLPCYASYTFTDISAGFFTAAKEKLAGYDNIEFKVLDISKDPLLQGFDAESYDLVIASNVLHATPRLHETLCHVRELLSSEGRLMLQELCSQSKWCNYVVGTLPGWWIGAGDGRADEPYVDPDRWEEELLKAGFDGLEAKALDVLQPYTNNVIMIARLVKPATRKRPVIIVRDGSSNSSSATLIAEALTQANYRVTISGLDQAPQPGNDVIMILDSVGPFLYNVSEVRLEALKSFFWGLTDSGIFWITRGFQVECKDPRFAQIAGLARVLRNELAVPLATCEVDDLDASLPIMLKVFETYTSRRSDDLSQVDLEYAIRDGMVYTSQYHPFNLADRLGHVTSQEEGEATSVKLEIETPGQLSSLRWVSTINQVRDDEVEINIQFAGLNFKDVLIAMGVVESDTSSLGFEGTGIVRQVGNKVSDLTLGDRVMFMGDGAFATTVVVKRDLCSRLPNRLSFENGATMPCVYGTVIHSLMDVGQLYHGQSILIHSACGGIGIAAIQISRMLGAEIYCTVGSDEKVRYLMATFEIPRGHIFFSRNDSFRYDLVKVTGGRGVDVVLNSLSGELLHASWQCVAEFGKLIEIGKRDLVDRGRLEMSIFEANRSYCGIDLYSIMKRRPHACHRLLEKMIEYYEAGHIQSIRPITTFKAAEITDCFRYMQNGQHIGKIVVDMSADPVESLRAAKIPPSLQFDGNGSYLLVGGLGGLGKSLSQWMVDHGARSLVYLGRSAGKSEADHDFFRDLESQGVTIAAVQGSVADLREVQRAAEASDKPIKGVLQMTMVLCERMFVEMSHEDWMATVTPKVDGTRNLHEATKDLNLDFFVLFSSLSCIIGQPGLANYAAANCFLNAFVQYRHSLGLPASSIDIGLVQDVGYVANNANLLSRFRTTGMYGIGEKELFDALHLAIKQSQPTQGQSERALDAFTCPSTFALGLRSTIPLSDPSNRVAWKSDKRMATYRNMRSTNPTTSAQPTTQSSRLTSILQAYPTDPSILDSKETPTILAEAIGLKLLDFLMKPPEELDLGVNLDQAGMDSLVAIEMRNWWKSAFGFDISVMKMLGMGSIAQLGDFCAEGLRAKIRQERGKTRLER